MSFKYRPEVDGLRALAVLPVVFFHAGLGAFPGGYVGVDVFFVISGYLITSILIEDICSKKYSLYDFYERRFRRIIPALAFVVACSCLLAWFFVPPGDMKKFSNSLIGVGLFSSNIVFWKESGYFDTSSELKPLLHTWSLAVEEQFYIFFPIFISLFWRVGDRFFAWSLVFLVVFGVVFSDLLISLDSGAAYYMLPSRGWELLVGSYVSVLFFKNKEHGFFCNNLFREIVSIFGFLLVVIPVFLFTSETRFPGYSAVVPVLGAALIIYSANKDTYVGRFLSFKPLVFVGLLSYSAYLWHQPVFAFSRIYFDEMPGELWFLFMTLVVFGLSFLTWRFVETPFRDRGKFGRVAIFSISMSLIFGMALFGLAGKVTNGFEFRIDDDRRAVLRTAIPSPLRKKCHYGVGYRDVEMPPCEYFKDVIDWAVLGDSHAVELAYELAKKLAPHGKGVRHYTNSGCPPVFSELQSDDACANWTVQSLRSIEEDKNIQYVVLAYRFNLHLFGSMDGRYPENVDLVGAELRNKRVSDFKKIVHRLKLAGKNVIVVMQAPEMGKHIESLVMRSGSVGDDISGSSRGWWDSRNYFSRRFLISLGDQIDLLVDPTSSFCDLKYCYAAKDGVALYFDDDHISLSGAELVVNLFNKYL